MGSGMPEALGLRVAAELGDLRLEAQPVIDLPGGRWSGPLTLRHPGAPRLAEALGLTGVPAWLGDGSLSLVSQLSAAPGRLAAESFDLTAGALRASGALALDRGEVRRLTGRVAADTLPLPLPYLRSPDPLPFGALAALLGSWQGAVRVEAGRVLAGFSPVLDKAAATLALDGGVLRAEGLEGQLAGGTLAGTASLDLNAARRP